VYDIRLTLTGNAALPLVVRQQSAIGDRQIPVMGRERAHMTFTNPDHDAPPLHHTRALFAWSTPGVYSPMKHTFDIPSMGTVTIEFEADETRD
jgi:hypothetical protein